MQIAKDKVVSIHYTLTNDKGETLDSSAGHEPMAYLQGHMNIIPGLEKALEGKSAGDKINTVVAPEEAYGPKNDGLVEEVPKEMFQGVEQIEPGMQFHAQNGQGATQIITVVSVGDDTVKVDGNHPLAGETLTFDVEVMDVREASAEELEHGHVHGPGGHDH
jgi:FKBP-type peptidyl-prolyl cis-trans isomerase SlyD